MSALSEKAGNRKRLLILFLSLLLIAGFLTTSLVSYYVSLTSLRRQITATALPLTSDNVYSEVQRDLLRPITIASQMAQDTFLRDWVLDGETNVDRITRYLEEVRAKNNMFSSFFVSDATRKYYYPEGVLKEVSEDEPRDVWYYRVRKMTAEYEVNVDPDMANMDAMTVFINHRVYDYGNRFIGATGVGLTTEAVITLIEDYSQRFGCNIYFTGIDGKVMLHNSAFREAGDSFGQIAGLDSISRESFAPGRASLQYRRNGELVHVDARFIPELKWYLLVEQTDKRATKDITSALTANLIFCAVITAIAILLTTLTINVYERISARQEAVIDAKHSELRAKNTEIKGALAEVKRLGGLLPICSSCKKIRDDKGYWQQIESYIREHSDADFSHGICPNCAERLYPEYTKNDEDWDKPKS